MKKPKLHNNPLSWVEPKKNELQGVKLSDVQYVSPAKLKPNDLNTSFFKEESTEYFDKLREDIRQRGIIVPLLAKTDDTLLAGHNRLRMAHELSLETVPVQYVLDTLSPESEREFLIKDNLYRRQFSTAEWITLYKKLYPDFDEQIQQETRGGGLKWSKTEHSVLLDNTSKTSSEADGRVVDASSFISAEARLTAQKIADDTGQKLSAVQKQLSKYRKGLHENTSATAKSSTVKNAVVKNTLDENTVEEVSELLKSVEQKARNESEKTIRHIIKKIDALKSKLEKLV